MSDLPSATRRSAALAYLDAVKGVEGARAALETKLADAVELLSPFAQVTGKEAVLGALDNPMVAGFFGGATWGEAESDGADVVTLTGTLPPVAPIGGFKVNVGFDADDRIARVQQEMLRPEPLDPLPIELDDDTATALSSCIENNSVPILGYVDDAGQPHLSLRATVQVFGKDQLAVWARDPNGGLPRAVVQHPRLTIFQREPTGMSTVYYGRGRLATDEERDRVYANSPEPERNIDYQRRGVAIIIDLDKVEGIGAGGRILMERDA
jgi:hypothetical protein